MHDAQIKERGNGQRGRGGRPIAYGRDVDGWPLASRESREIMLVAR